MKATSIFPRTPSPISQLPAVTNGREDFSATASDFEATLPLLATASDLREVVRFLRKRPAGTGIVEAMEVTKKQMLDPRKIAAYEAWGLVTRDRDRLSLSAFGCEIAELLQPEIQAFRAVLNRSPLYRQTLEWISRHCRDLVTHDEVIAAWRQEFAAVTDHTSEKNIRGNVVTFFHLCHAADLGTLTIGKRGQPSRLRVDHDELADCLLAEPAPSADLRPAPAQRTASAQAKLFSLPVPLAPACAVDNLRVLVIHSDATEISGQVRASLELTEHECLIVARNDAPGLPISDALAEAMRSCAAGIIVIGESDCVMNEAGSLAPRPQALFEISAACVLYGRRVILLCEHRVTLPPELAGISRCDFDGRQLSWESGLALMKTIRELDSAERAQSAFQTTASSLLQ
jgi:hypothetical protein